MTNRSASQQHGLHSMNETRPKSKLRNRRNKVKAKARKEASPMLSLHTKIKGETPKAKAKTAKPKTTKTAAKKPTAKKPVAKKSETVEKEA